MVIDVLDRELEEEELDTLRQNELIISFLDMYCDDWEIISAKEMEINTYLIQVEVQIFENSDFYELEYDANNQQVYWGR